MYTYIFTYILRSKGWKGLFFFSCILTVSAPGYARFWGSFCYLLIRNFSSVLRLKYFAQTKKKKKNYFELQGLIKIARSLWWSPGTSTSSASCSELIATQWDETGYLLDMALSLGYFSTQIASWVVIYKLFCAKSRMASGPFGDIKEVRAKKIIMDLNFVSYELMHIMFNTFSSASMRK